MEALFSQLSSLASQALDGKDAFDLSKIQGLLTLFEQEAYGSWAAADAELLKAAADVEVSMREAEDCLDSLTEAAMADFRRSCDKLNRTAAVELSSLERSADATQKVGKSLGDAASSASEKYIDVVMASATAATKSTFASSRIHP